MSFDTDGSVLDSNDTARGEVIRDKAGNWIRGYCNKLPNYPTAITEICGMIMD